MYRKYSATYEHGPQLAAAGCALPYLCELPRQPKGLIMCELEGYGYIGAQIFDICAMGGTGYVIGLSLATDLADGIVVCDWRFTSPWPEHVISWSSGADASRAGLQ